MLLINKIYLRRDYLLFIQDKEIKIVLNFNAEYLKIAKSINNNNIEILAEFYELPLIKFPVKIDQLIINEQIEKF